jgi:hypothetical protein
MDKTKQTACLCNLMWHRKGLSASITTSQNVLKPLYLLKDTDINNTYFLILGNLFFITQGDTRQRKVGRLHKMR